MRRLTMRSRRLGGALALTLGLGALGAQAGELSEADIARALSSGPAAKKTSASDGAFFEALGKKQGVSLSTGERKFQGGEARVSPGDAKPDVRSDAKPEARPDAKPDAKPPATEARLSPEERRRLDTALVGKPKVDLEMEFAYNSDVLEGRALETANKLGRVLSSEQNKGQTFVIAGHTDGKGSAATNQKLSERRADSVRRYLVTNYGISPGNLISVGYGKSQLKNKADPLAAENRRVQAINTETPRTAGR